MTIGGEATKIGAEVRMEIMADEAALEGGAVFEAEVVFEGVSGAVEEGTVEGGRRDDNLWERMIESLFDQQSIRILFVYIITLQTSKLLQRAHQRHSLCATRPHHTPQTTYQYIHEGNPYLSSVTAA